MIVCLVLATLPWRAYLGAGVGAAAAIATPAVAVAASLDRLPETERPVTIDSDAARPVALTVPCPGPKLPGSVCPAPVAILPGEAVLPVRPGSDIQIAAETVSRDLWQPERPRDPPRSC